MGLYVLADGMGGARAGERASKLAVETVADAIRRASSRDSEALLTAVENANRAVLGAARNDAELEGMGTTLVAALDTESGLAIASVGDSRAYLFDERGFRRITEDQSWVNEVGRPLGLDERALRTHPMRHVLTMAIGSPSPLVVNRYNVALAPGATVLLCSDGLHGVLEEVELKSILGAGSSLEERGRNLIAAAKSAGGPDNITVVLIHRPCQPRP